MPQFNIEDDLAGLLRLNYDVVEALAGKKPKDRELAFGEGLSQKLFGHAVSAFHLKRNRTNLRIPSFDFDVKFVDWASLQVLARASIEVAIAFNYVFRDPASKDEAEFRYLAWMLAGFVQRESFPVQTPEGKKQIAIDIKTNAQMRRRIMKTAVFQGLTERQKKSVLGGKDWHPGKTLSAMCDEIIGPTWGRSLYGFMSSHAHSDALSAVQVHQTRDQASELANPPLIVIALAVAGMSEAYARKWVASKKVYQTHLYRDLNEIYLHLRT